VFIFQINFKIYCEDLKIIIAQISKIIVFHLAYSNFLTRQCEQSTQSIKEEDVQYIKM